MLLQLMISVIPMFFLLVFKLPMGVRMELQSLMRGFWWKELGLRKSRVMAPVTKELICKPTKLGD